MKNKTAQAIKALRKIVNLTQAELAVMIGASKDTVASWEVGRNRLSASFARRIALATGVDGDDLLKGRNPLRVASSVPGRRVFTAEDFAAHRHSYWGQTGDAAARKHLRNASDALALILQAAAQPGEDQPGCLPAVMGSFIQWCEQTREDFRLEKSIDHQLAERTTRVELTKTYKAWRVNQKEDPDMCRAMGFRDDPSEADDALLTLGVDTMPLWRPGYAMRGELRKETP